MEFNRKGKVTMARILHITLPQPPKACWPNIRAHHMAVYRAKKTYMNTTRLIAKANWDGPPCAKAELRITWDSCTHQAPDPDNVIASCKASIDGLEKAGVIGNDRNLIIMPVTIRRKQPAPAVHLEVREVVE